MLYQVNNKAQAVLIVDDNVKIERYWDLMVGV